MSPGVYLLIAVVVVAAILVMLARLARQASGAAFAGECDEFMQAQGTRRCELAVGLVRHLAKVQPEERIHDIWEAIEIPLVEALPDCPPGLKPSLIKRLDALHGHCRNREYQRRIMTVRNSLV